MSSAIDDAGSYVPFVDGMPDCEDWELEVLKEVEIHVWPYGGNDNDAPDKCTVQLCAFYKGDSIAEQSAHLMVDLIDVIRQTFDSKWCGPKAETIALRKLVAGINEIIAHIDAENAC